MGFNWMAVETNTDHGQHGRDKEHGNSFIDDWSSHLRLVCLVWILIQSCVDIRTI